MMREIEPPGINARQIGELEQLVRAVRPGQMQHEIALRVREIEAKPPRYSLAQTATGIGAACGAFAFLNGGAGPEIVAAGIGGGVGQWLRSLLSRKGFNHFGITAVRRRGFQRLRINRVTVGVHRPWHRALQYWFRLFSTVPDTRLPPGRCATRSVAISNSGWRCPPCI